MTEKKKNEEIFISCPDCGGDGKGRINFNCFSCSGMGTGAFFYEYFLYYSRPLNRTTIFWRRFKNYILKTVDILAMLSGLAGIGALVWWIWSYDTLDMMDYLMFWNIKNPFILIFWVGVLFFLFVFYRLSRVQEKTYKIGALEFKNEGLPDNWGELRKYKKKFNVSDTIGEEMLRCLEDSFLLAEKKSHKNIKPLHFLLSLLENNEVKAMFIRLNTDRGKLIEKLKRQLDKEEEKGGEPVASKKLKKALVRSFMRAYKAEQKQIKPINAVFPCLKEDKVVYEILWDMGITEDKVHNVEAWFKTDKDIRDNLQKFKKMARFKPKTNMDRAYTAVATPVLNKISYDLTLAAKYGRLNLCVARDKEIKEIFDILGGKNNSLVLTGSPGVGKRTIVYGIARRMVREEVPDFLKDKRFLELDAARLVSGANPAQAEERLLTILDEVVRAGNIVLYIENINRLVGISSGDEGSMDLSEVLTSALEKMQLFLLASSDNRSYHKHVEESSIGNTMSRIKIPEPKNNRAIQIVESKVGTLEYKYNVFFTYNAIDGAVNLSDKYIHDKFLPEKAVDILERAAIKLSENKKSKKIIMCGKNDVAAIVKEITQIPVDEVKEDEGKKLINLEKEIHKYMVNQNEAVDVVADSLRRARAELRNEKKTIANFLFLGPTGVGKTELAKTVARVYFGKKDYLIRLDMSEYQHEDSVTKMIGDENGAGGYLTEAVRKNPFSLILLDEFEKANKKILDLFLQVMDDGRLTDGGGRTVDFTNSILIATSNIASVFIQEEVAKGTEVAEMKNKLINEKLIKEMRPEMVNRFDGVIIFKPLSIKNVAEIAKLTLKGTKKMLEEKGVFFEANEEGVKKLAREGYDPKFGARPLKRVLQEKVDNEIAKKILSGELKRRDTVVINNEGKVTVAKGREL